MTTPGEMLPMLKECPFCGPKGKTFIHQIGNEFCKRRGAEVGCNNCHFKKFVLVLRQPIPWALDKAVEIWNTRTPPKSEWMPQVTEAIENLERVAGKQIAVWKAGNLLGVPGHYETWNDGEYWIKKALEALRNIPTGESR